MKHQITLEITTGGFQGKRFIFDKIITILVGRNRDCYVQLPQEDTTVSRYHCLIDIDPFTHPFIKIRDYGSYTGTYLNEQKIGQRQLQHSHEESSQTDYPLHALKTGDEIRIGQTTLRVSIETLSEENWAKPQIALDSINKPFLANSPPEIPNYSIRQKLGQGGFGCVYLAHCEKTQKSVALKVIHPQKQADKSTRKKFLREVEISKFLSHPHVVQVLDSGEVKDLLFLVLELCPCGTVNDWLKKQKYRGRIPIEIALDIIDQTLDALEYAHTVEFPSKQLPDGTLKPIQGIVHRDLKPSNILCSTDGDRPIIKVADFGLAKAFDLAGLSSSGYTSERGNAETPTVSGTYAFMCRQQVLDFKYAKPEVDVWAAAACLYQMLTGRLPRDFSCPQSREFEFWKVVLEAPTVPIRKYNALIPLRLAEVIDRALMDRSSLHFKTAQEFKQALRSAYL